MSKRDSGIIGGRRGGERRGRRRGEELVFGRHGVEVEGRRDGIVGERGRRRRRICLVGRRRLPGESGLALQLVIESVHAHHWLQRRLAAGERVWSRAGERGCPAANQRKAG